METLAADLRTMVRTPLHDDHIAAMRRVGTEDTLKAGETLYRPGDVMDRFCYVLEGEVEAVDPRTGGATAKARRSGRHSFSARSRSCRTRAFRWGRGRCRTRAYFASAARRCWT